MELWDIIKNNIDEVYMIGTAMKYLHNELKTESILSKHFTERKSLLNFVKKLDPKNSVILVKGSRGIKMEEFVTVIISKSTN